MSKDIQFLEKVKYYLFLKTNWRIIFSGHGNYLDKFWDLDGYIDLTLPENIDISTSLISARLDLWVSDIKVNSLEADKRGYNRRHIPLNLFNSIDDLNNVPLANIDAGVFCYHNITEDYKRYVFAFKDYYDKFSIYQNESRIVKEVKEYLHYKPTYASLFKFALSIHVKSDSITSFETFLSMPYGNELTPNTWRYYFNQAIVSSKTGDQTKIMKYDFSIVSEEISIEDRKYLLTNFWSLNMESSLVLALLTPPKNDEVTARQIYQHLQFSSSNILLALWNYFQQLLTTDADNPFFKFNNCLLELSQHVLTSDDVETIGVKEVEVYENYTGQWNLFHKLAEEANVFAHCMNPYESRFGMMRFGAEPPLMEPHPFSQSNPKTINFSYRAFEMSPPSNEYTQFNGFPIMPYISFNEFDPFKFVKVYLVEKPEQISGFNNYEKFISILFSDPQNVPREDEQKDERHVRFIYMPAICAYNLYLMNNYSLHVEIRTYLISVAVTIAGVYFSFINVARYSFAWFLATGTSAVAITSLTINAPGVRQEILDKYGTDGQEFLDAWDIIETTTITLNFAYFGFYGARNIYQFVSNVDNITSALETFAIRYQQLSLKLQRILNPIYKSFYKTALITLEEYVDYVSRLNPILQNGKSYMWILDYKNLNGQFPLPSSYIKPDKLVNYLNDLQTEELAFFISKREIVSQLDYQTLPPSKFAGFTSDMEKILQNFNVSGKNVQQLIGDLKVAKNKFLVNDEIFIVKVKMGEVHSSTNFQFDMPTGNEPGVNIDFFRPGGILPSVDDLVNVGQKIYPREAIIKNANSMAHNNDWDSFKSIFGNNNVIQIYP